ncbi:MAG: hypothetical protein V3T08_10275 [Gemmatimonadota bacterium]
MSEQPISVPAYTALSVILDPSGPGIRLATIESTVIPVQDLSRILQGSQARHFVYFKEQALVADSTVSLQWNDASDWDEIAANNIPITLDPDLPASDGSVNRLLVSVGLALSVTVAEWNSSVLRRTAAIPTALNTHAWSAVKANLLGGNVVPNAPNLLPVALAPGEVSVELDTDITFTVGVTLKWVIEMIVAPRGVMAVYPGV